MWCFTKNIHPIYPVLKWVGSKTHRAIIHEHFRLYFLGFTNLLFGWAHHTYILPAAPWIRVVAYSISMSELIILARIIWQWRSTVAQAKLNYPVFRTCS